MRDEKGTDSYVQLDLLLTYEHLRRIGKAVSILSHKSTIHFETHIQSGVKEQVTVDVTSQGEHQGMFRIVFAFFPMSSSC